jgi:hypothetical protein
MGCLRRHDDFSNAQDPLTFARATLAKAQPDGNCLAHPAFTEATPEGLPTREECRLADAG